MRGEPVPARPGVGEVVTLRAVDLDGRKLALEPGQAVVPHGVDRGLDAEELTAKGGRRWTSAGRFGIGRTEAEPGSARANYLVVPDVEAARRDLAGRGVPVGPLRHKASAD